MKQATGYLSRKDLNRKESVLRVTTVLALVAGVGVVYTGVRSWLDRGARLTPSEVVVLVLPVVAGLLVAVALGAGQTLASRASREAALLRQLSELLVGARDVDEALEVLHRAVTRLPGVRPTVLLVDGDELVEWLGERRWDLDACMAVRLGRPHASDDTASVIATCRHVDDDSLPHLCLPLATPGQSLGVLHLVGDGVGAAFEMATAMASQAAMTLAVLKLEAPFRERRLEAGGLKG